MDSFVTEARRETNPKTMKTNLTHFEDTLSNNLHNLDQVLLVLDPRAHSLGYLFVLKAKINDQRKNPQSYIAQVTTFLSACNAEFVQAAPTQFCQVCRHYTDLLFQVRQPSRGVLPLRRALGMLITSSTQLTPVHADFLQLCILSKCYHMALPVVSQSITDVNPDQTSITIRDVLCYFYYAGIVFSTLKMYRQALDAFRQVWTAPATAISAIAIEAYKKYYLVFLMMNGTTPGFPNYTPIVVQRAIKNHCKAYSEFGTSIINGNINEIHAKASSNAETFSKDNNMGLVKLAIKSIHRRNIKKLTQTYMTLSIQNIAEHVKLTPTEAEAIVLKMIEDGEIFATISQKDGMVTFHENPESYSGHKILNELDHQVKSVFALDGRLRAMDEKFSVSQAYLKRLVSSEKKLLQEEQFAMMEDVM
ncbi:hypothetical protein SAMD00019534_075550 [Acytostelium subglobosum LB1]|uniref:hypothetical protein n=1 Tax=Acytostelium subglobosum LB1 TaxID=1410327 RepID=UPI0006448118|nr:hypothetical protein SAMD00019534_075550 [Acytostelium subglobosum LB1]GAM24380.1 hypothetical protein SAMD00019534_075550 [Acytostelium subglobosum LB1]|eukprot:XP_012752706.1 hypothetical protein SAMD00019534_075550 [Acytostelium subglobosum LB1]